MGNCVSHVNISLTVGDKLKRRQTPENLATAVKEKGEPRRIWTLLHLLSSHHLTPEPFLLLLLFSTERQGIVSATRGVCELLAVCLVIVFLTEKCVEILVTRIEQVSYVFVFCLFLGCCFCVCVCVCGFVVVVVGGGVCVCVCECV